MLGAYGKMWTTIKKKTRLSRRLVNKLVFKYTGRTKKVAHFLFTGLNTCKKKITYIHRINDEIWGMKEWRKEEINKKP